MKNTPKKSHALPVFLALVLLAALGTSPALAQGPAAADSGKATQSEPTGVGSFPAIEDVPLKGAIQKAYNDTFSKQYGSMIKKLDDIDETGQKAGTSTSAQVAAHAQDKAVENQGKQDYERMQHVQDKRREAGKRNRQANDAGKTQIMAAMMTRGQPQKAQTARIAQDVVQDWKKALCQDQNHECNTVTMAAKVFAQGCKYLDMCDVTGGGGGGGASGSNEDHSNIYPAAFSNAIGTEKKGSRNNDIQLASTGGGGGSDLYRGAAFSPGRLHNASDNVALQSGKDGMNAMMTMIVVNSTMESFYMPPKSKDTQNVDFNWANAKKKAHDMAMADGVIAMMDDDFSIPDAGTCKYDKNLDTPRKNDGFQPNQETCMSKRQYAQVQHALEVQGQKSNMYEQSASNGFAKNNSYVQSASRAAAVLGIGGNSGSSTFSPAAINAAYPGVTTLLEDPRFYAILKTPEFKRQYAYYRAHLPELYAEQNKMIAAIIRRDLGEVGNDTMLAENQMEGPKQPASDDDLVVPKAPHETSASLSQFFAASGVNIGGGMASMPVLTAETTAPSMPATPVVPVKAQGQPQVVLVSDHPAQ